MKINLQNNFKWLFIISMIWLLLEGIFRKWFFLNLSGPLFYIKYILFGFTYTSYLLSNNYSTKIVHTKQHKIGSWYFILCNLPLISWLKYSYYNTRRFIIYKKSIYRFYSLPQALFRFITSFFIALTLKIKDPKFIKIDV